MLVHITTYCQTTFHHTLNGGLSTCVPHGAPICQFPMVVESCSIVVRGCAAAGRSFWAVLGETRRAPGFSGPDPGASIAGASRCSYRPSYADRSVRLPHKPLLSAGALTPFGGCRLRSGVEETCQCVTYGTLATSHHKLVEIIQNWHKPVHSKTYYKTHYIDNC